MHVEESGLLHKDLGKCLPSALWGSVVEYHLMALLWGHCESAGKLAFQLGDLD